MSTNNKIYFKPKDRERKKVTGKENRTDFAFTPNWGRNMRSSLNDAQISFQDTKELRAMIDEAFDSNDNEALRKISRHFNKVSGVYGSVVRYLENTLTFDHLVYPKPISLDLSKDYSQIEKETFIRLQLIDDARLKNSLREITRNVILDGVSYVYMRHRGNRIVFQELPIAFCRLGGYSNGYPTVQFNLDYFDATFSNERDKLAQVNKFPSEIVEEYYRVKEDRRSGKNKYGSDRVANQNSGMTGSAGTWVQLEPTKASAFYFTTNLQPILSNSFYSILDYLEIKAVEKVKNENELYNLVVQQFPLDNEGEPVIDFVEMEQFHNSGKQIFKDSNQTDLLTTFADVKNVNLNESMGEQYDTKPWRLDVYGDLGVSPQLFSTEGNLALERSITVDEALLFGLLNKYEDWLNFFFFQELDKPNEGLDEDVDGTRTQFSIWFPPVTYANRENFVKEAKDRATNGYSILLPAIASGQSQISMLALNIYESRILNLPSMMIPLQSSHTQSGKEQGRPSLPNSEKSDKTIQNQGG